MEEKTMRRSFQHRTVEALEQKRMNAANLIGNAMAAAPAASSTVQTATAATGSVNAGAAAANANVAGSTHMTAALSGTGAGTLKLVSGMANGSANANLMVHLTGAPANQTFDVSVGGNVIGSISTNANGAGVLHLNSALHNADALLAALPTLGADAAVTVGVSGQTPILTGTLQAAANAGASVGANLGNVSAVVDGALAKVTNLEDTVFSTVNSLVDKVDARVDHTVDSLLGVTNNLESAVDRLVGRVDNLTASLVDKVFSTVDNSALLGRIDSLLPIDLSGIV